MEPSEKSTRLLEAACALLAHVPGNDLNITVLNKALFYLDLVCLRDFGAVFTHNTYIALKRGPAVAKYDRRLVPGLEERGWARQSEIGESKPVHLCGSPSREYVTNEIDEKAKTVAQWASRLSSDKASDYSHENVAWQIAYRAGRGEGGPPLPLDMNIALQQIIDVSSDPWLDSGLNEDETAAVDLLGDPDVVPW